MAKVEMNAGNQPRRHGSQLGRIHKVQSQILQSVKALPSAKLRDAAGKQITIRTIPKKSLARSRLKVIAWRRRSSEVPDSGVSTPAQPKEAEMRQELKNFAQRGRLKESHNRKKPLIGSPEAGDTKRDSQEYLKIFLQKSMGNEPDREHQRSQTAKIIFDKGIGRDTDQTTSKNIEIGRSETTELTAAESSYQMLRQHAKLISEWLENKKKTINPNSESTQERYIQLANVCFDEVMSSASYAGNEFRDLLGRVAGLRQAAYQQVIRTLKDQVNNNEDVKKDEIEAIKRQHMEEVFGLETKIETLERQTRQAQRVADHERGEGDYARKKLITYEEENIVLGKRIAELTEQARKNTARIRDLEHAHAHLDASKRTMQQAITSFFQIDKVSRNLLGFEQLRAYDDTYLEECKRLNISEALMIKMNQFTGAYSKPKSERGENPLEASKVYMSSASSDGKKERAMQFAKKLATSKRMPKVSKPSHRELEIPLMDRILSKTRLMHRTEILLEVAKKTDKKLVKPLKTDITQLKLEIEQLSAQHNDSEIPEPKGELFGTLPLHPKILRLFINENRPTAAEYKDVFDNLNRDVYENWVFGPTKHLVTETVDITKARHPLDEGGQSSEEIEPESASLNDPYDLRMLDNLDSMKVFGANIIYNQLRAIEVSDLGGIEEKTEMILSGVQDAVSAKKLVKQSDFTEVFDSELRTLDSFTTIMKEVQRIICDGKTVQNAIMYGSKATKQIARESKAQFKKSGQLSAQVLKAALMGDDLQWDQGKTKKVYSMRLEGLYDVCLVLISRLLLSKPDHFLLIIGSIRRKLGKRWSVMSAKWGQLKAMIREGDFGELIREEINSAIISDRNRDLSSQEFGVDRDLFDRILGKFETKKKPKTAEAGTQTDEPIDSIIGLLQSGKLRVKPNKQDPHQRKCFETMLDHNKRLCRFRIYTEATHLEVFSEEYVPSDQLHQFLPFSCVYNMLRGYENFIEGQMDSGDAGSGAVVRKKYEREERHFRDIQEYLQFRKGGGKLSRFAQQVYQASVELKGTERKLIESMFGFNYKDLDLRVVLNEYFKILKETSEAFPIDPASMYQLRMMSLSNTKKIKSQFQQLPPHHQLIINQMLDRAVEAQCVDTAKMKDEKEVRRLQDQAEAEIDRLWDRIDQLHSRIRTLETKARLLEGSGDIEARLSELEAAVRSKLIAVGVEYDDLDTVVGGRLVSEYVKSIGGVERIAQDSYDRGFELGLMHGKFMTEETRRNLHLHMGQQNGIKHGWLSGFEAGQVSGIKKVFKEAYLHNINLYEDLKEIQDARGHSSVLDLIKVRDLQSEGMNAFMRTFHQHQSTASDEIESKHVVFKLTEKFRKAGHHARTDTSALSKKTLNSYIIQAYKDQKEYIDQSAKEKNQVSFFPLLETVNQRMSVELGHTDVKDKRFTRLMYTAVNAASEPISRDDKFLKKTFNELKLFEHLSNPLAEINQEDLKIRLNLRIVHFCKFCQLLNASNNLSGEVLNFYLNIYHGFLEPQEQDDKPKGAGSGKQLAPVIRLKTNCGEVDCLAEWRANKVLNSHLKPLMPFNMFKTFLVTISRLLLVQKNPNSIEKWYDMDRLLDWSILMFLRFNGKHNISLQHRVFYALTLFTSDYIEFDLVYLLIKLLQNDKMTGNQAKSTKHISFHYPKESQIVAMHISKFMQNVHDQSGILKETNEGQNLSFEARLEKMEKGHGAADPTYDMDLVRKLQLIGGFQEQTRFTSLDTQVHDQIPKIKERNSGGKQNHFDSDVRTKMQAYFKKRLNQTSWKAMYHNRENVFVDCATFIKLFKGCDLFTMPKIKMILNRVNVILQQRNEPTPFVQVSDDEELEAGKIIKIDGVLGQKVTEKDANRLSDRFDGRYFAEQVDPKTGGRNIYNPLLNPSLHAHLTSRMTRLRNHLNDLAKIVVDSRRYKSQINVIFENLKQDEEIKANKKLKRRASVLTNSKDSSVEQSPGKRSAVPLQPPVTDSGSGRERSGTITTRSRPDDLVTTSKFRKEKSQEPRYKEPAAYMAGQKVDKDDLNSIESVSISSHEFQMNPGDLNIQQKSKEQQLFDQAVYGLTLEGKPYFCDGTLGKWKERLDRLEKRMLALAPDLVFLSFDLFESMIMLLKKKVQKQNDA